MSHNIYPLLIQEKDSLRLKSLFLTNITHKIKRVQLIFKWMQTSMQYQITLILYLHHNNLIMIYMKPTSTGKIPLSSLLLITEHSSKTWHLLMLIKRKLIFCKHRNIHLQSRRKRFMWNQLFRMDQWEKVL